MQGGTAFLFQLPKGENVIEMRMSVNETDHLEPHGSQSAMGISAQVDNNSFFGHQVAKGWAIVLRKADKEFIVNKREDESSHPKSDSRTNGARKELRILLQSPTHSAKSAIWRH